jgi:hypothetical protein
MTYEQALSRASGHYLCRHLPTDWAKWDQTKIDRFISKWKSELIEDQPIEVIHEYIETLALDMLRLLNEQKA